jgi:cellulose 1,4-beta-cellobiosidase
MSSQMFSTVFLSLFALSRAQGIGQTQEETLPMKWQKCGTDGGCQDVRGKVTIDANWRWTHNPGKTDNCYKDNTWSGCSSVDACSKCEVEGLKKGDYSNTYGIESNGAALSLSFVKKHQYGTNIGGRLYMLDDKADKYQMYNLLNSEFSFDVDLATVGCGINAALYFVSMEADGGQSKYGQKAGPKYGTGYCDSQCPRDLKFINGKVCPVPGYL